MSIAKQFRIHLEKDFDRVMQEGTYVRGRDIALKYHDNAVGFSRFSVLVGKKISLRAVVRNRLKRRIKETIRLHLGSVRKGLDIVFFPRPMLAKTDFNSIQQAVTMILKKAGLL